MPHIRLDRIISETGTATRREAAAMIKRGLITVDGIPVFSGAEKYDPEVSIITVNSKKLEYVKFRYIMLNKPQGCVSATEDRYEMPVTELLDDKYRGVFPVGRLDKDTEGLLLLTNDGKFAHSVTSPSKEVQKRYFAETDGDISHADIEAFACGLTLGDGTVCAPAILEKAGECGVYVTLYEGKYHQVKRMLAAIGKHVIYLKRISIGGLELDKNLAPGEYRELTKEEISALFDKR